MANGKVLVLLFIAAVPFHLLFKYRTKTLRDVSGVNNPTLDSDFFHTPQTAYQLFGKLDDPSRQLYAWTEITADLIFPVIYSLFLSLLLICIFRKLSSVRVQQTLAMLPLMAMLSDFCENILIAFMLFAYPQVYLGVAWAASLFTKLKWILLTASLAAILFGLVGLVIKALSKTKQD
ncbi:MAG: hypothetical protein H7Z16_07645 [Pyrinomonadaceae bacterium]|nr:hypothetical protein [Pyrinomonadaceae bacterium]